jgi:hypothetical protein
MAGGQSDDGEVEVNRPGNENGKPAHRIVFEIAGPEYDRLMSWIDAIDAGIVRRQIEAGQFWRGTPPPEESRQAVLEELAREGLLRPYYGVSGGGYVFTFCPTSLGTVVRVRNTMSEDEIDLTDYESW